MFAGLPNQSPLLTMIVQIKVQKVQGDLNFLAKISDMRFPRKTFINTQELNLCFLLESYHVKWDLRAHMDTCPSELYKLLRTFHVIYFVILLISFSSLSVFFLVLLQEAALTTGTTLEWPYVLWMTRLLWQRPVVKPSSWPIEVTEALFTSSFWCNSTRSDWFHMNVPRGTMNTNGGTEN